MRKIRLLCIISIFLSGVFSANAENTEDLIPLHPQGTGGVPPDTPLVASLRLPVQSTEDLELAAVKFERAAWEASSLEEVNAALVARAACCKALGRYADAVEALGRVRMFALSEEDRATVLYQQELCLFLGGEFSSAAAMVPQVEPVSQDVLLLHTLALAYAGRYAESEIMAARCISFYGPSEHLDGLLALYRTHPQERSVNVSVALGFLPPSGHAYNGEFGEGLLSLGLNALSIGFTVASLLGGYWVTGILGGGILMSYTVMGGMERSIALFEKNGINEPVIFGDRVREFMATAL